MVSTSTQDDDVRAIEAVIRRQFRSASWTADKPADWESFAGDFHADASLFAAARPAKPQSVEDFVARMRSLAGTTLRSFEETPLGSEVLVFGNVAVALGACENLENGAEVTRNVEAFLLVKDGGVWRIAGQAWDLESDAKPLPQHLADAG